MGIFAYNLWTEEISDYTALEELQHVVIHSFSRCRPARHIDLAALSANDTFLSHSRASFSFTCARIKISNKNNTTDSRSSCLIEIEICVENQRGILDTWTLIHNRNIHMCFLTANLSTNWIFSQTKIAYLKLYVYFIVDSVSVQRALNGYAHHSCDMWARERVRAQIDVKKINLHAWNIYQLVRPPLYMRAHVCTCLLLGRNWMSLHPFGLNNWIHFLARRHPISQTNNTGDWSHVPRNWYIFLFYLSN